MQIAQQRNLKLTPYVVGNFRDYGRNQRAHHAWLGDCGVDLKYSLTPRLTLDATYNTDFAQVEVDEQRINLDRFNLLFSREAAVFPGECQPVLRRHSR